MPPTPFRRGTVPSDDVNAIPACFGTTVRLSVPEGVESCQWTASSEPTSFLAVYQWYFGVVARFYSLKEELRA